MIEKQNIYRDIGMEHIKDRRLKIEVACNPGTMVGEYVPFYFCPRSVMLFVISRGHSNVTYKGGQQEVIHLVSSIEIVTKDKERLWAFSDGNAGASYTDFYNDINEINDVLNWSAIKAHYWSDPPIQNAKQAEFLVHKLLKWEEIHDIGVYSKGVATRLGGILKSATHKPNILTRRNWYY
jgi:hypothetical protein